MVEERKETEDQKEARLAEVASTPAPEKLGWFRRVILRQPQTEEVEPESAEKATEATTEPANHEGVVALLSIATDAVADERERGRSLDGKTATLTGFAGLILTVAAAVAGPVFKHNLGSVGGPLARVCFVAAMVCLLLAVLIAILGVLMPQAYRGLGRGQLAEFTSREVQAHDALWVNQSMLGALANIMAQDRPVNDRKAELTTVVAWLLAAAFAFVAVGGVTLGLQHVGLS